MWCLYFQLPTLPTWGGHVSPQTQRKGHLKNFKRTKIATCFTICTVKGKECLESVGNFWCKMTNEPNMSCTMKRICLFTGSKFLQTSCILAEFRVGVQFPLITKAYRHLLWMRGCAMCFVPHNAGPEI